jgi:energy-coupling factor transporter ATP-binding protein EcfA2
MKRFVLAGNPNSGKTTLFNILTGSSAHVGNWPGVTVEKGRSYKKWRPDCHFGFAGSLFAMPVFSREIIARNAVLNDKPTASSMWSTPPTRTQSLFDDPVIGNRSGRRRLEHDRCRQPSATCLIGHWNQNLGSVVAISALKEAISIN